MSDSRLEYLSGMDDDARVAELAEETMDAVHGRVAEDIQWLYERKMTTPYGLAVYSMAVTEAVNRMLLHAIRELGAHPRTDGVVDELVRKYGGEQS